LIIDKCSGFFHPRSHEVDKGLDYLCVFEIEIGKVVKSSHSKNDFGC
jgi:hypothetical protein